MDYYRRGGSASEVQFDDVLVVQQGVGVVLEPDRPLVEDVPPVEQNARKGLSIADRGYVLDQGRVRFEDDADALLDDEDVVELYLGG